MGYLIGIDIGTTSTKVLAYSEDGRELARDEQSYPIYSPRPAYQEQDPETITKAVIAGLAAVRRAVGGQPLAVGLSCAMHGMLAVGSHGRPLTRCIIWADGRSYAQAAQLRATAAGSAIYQATGTPVHAMSPLCKIAWLREEEPVLFRASARFISMKEYLIHRLFGEYVVDHSLASATGLFDIRQRGWYAAALQWAGIEPERLSIPVPPRQQLSGLSRTVVAECGLGAEVPWVIGGSDGCLANLGAQVLAAGSAVVTIGTSGAIRQVRRGEVLVDPGERLFNYILADDYYVSGGAINTGGYLHQWFREQFLEMPEAAMAAMMAAAFRLEPGAGGLVALPYLLGERAPIWDSMASGAVVGFRSQHSAVHLLRALLEGVIFSIVQCGTAMEECGAPLDRIYANGGFTQSTAWVQMLADAAGCPVMIDDSPDAPARGAVIMALSSLGRLPALDAAVHFVQRQQEFLPSADHHERYRQLFSIYQVLYPALAAAMHGLASFSDSP